MPFGWMMESSMTLHGAGGGREAVGGGLELRGGIDKGVELGVF
jgi:hypothetical protein